MEDGGLIGDSFRSSPFKSDRDPIVVSFLLIGAKSKKAVMHSLMLKLRLILLFENSYQFNTNLTLNHN
jgi:hypothetical protein